MSAFRSKIATVMVLWLSAITSGAQRPSRAALRTAPDTSHTFRLELNLPTMRIDVWELGVLTMSLPVAIGTSYAQTPVGDFLIDYVEWNPRWDPPPKPWARDLEAQEPGPENWMGKVKMHVSDWIFLHGSSLDESIGNAESRGCIRLRDRDAMLVAQVMHQFASPELADSTVRNLMRSWTPTRRIALTHRVPIRIRYDRAVVFRDSLVIWRDPYARGVAEGRKQVINALTAAGLRADLIDERMITDALNAPFGRVAIALTAIGRR